MNLRDRYLRWNKKNNIDVIRVIGDSPRLDESIQFCDEFMEQCDKLEKKVNDLARENRELEDCYKQCASELHVLKLIKKEQEDSHISQLISSYQDGLDQGRNKQKGSGDE